MTAHNSDSADGFVPFFRSYTRTWIHAVATAGLTAFGTLTIVHRWFAALALASYVVPPLVLYFRHGRIRPRDDDASDASGSSTEREEPDSGRSDRADSTESADPATASDAATTATRRPSSAESSASTDRRPDEDAGSVRALERTDSTEEGGDENGVATATDVESESDGADEPAVDANDSVATTDDASEAAGTGTVDDASGAAGGGESADRDTETDESVDRDADTDESTDRDGARDESTRDENATEADESRPEWHAVDAPTEATLHDVTIAGANGACAVGAGGTVLASSDDSGGEWSILLEDGPAAQGNDLRGVDATADGNAVWVAGDSGSLGRIDPETGRHVDYTAPEDVTDNWLGVAVGGSSGEETVLLINGSGAVLRGEYREETLEWTGPNKPGSGSSFSGVALCADGVGYCCDTNDGVYETTDGGESFERVGLEGADGTLTDVATTGRGDCLVSADDGVVHRYDGPTWTPERVADGSIEGVARYDGRSAACADDAVYERDEPSVDWERFDTGASGALLAVAVGSGRGVAVGADGAIVTRG